MTENNEREQAWCRGADISPQDCPVCRRRADDTLECVHASTVIDAANAAQAAQDMRDKPLLTQAQPAPAGDSFDAKCERNSRVSARWDALMREGKHGHYETLFRVVREEVERDRLARSPEPAPISDERARLIDCLPKVGESHQFAMVDVDDLRALLAEKGTQ